MRTLRAIRGSARSLTVVLSALVLLAGCGTGSSPGSGSATGPEVATGAESESGSGSGSESGSGSGSTAQDCSATAASMFPDVVDATLSEAEDGLFTVSATVCSAYDTPQRYADAWRVTTPGGDVLGVRELLHDHAGEQPFTRSLGDPLEVPDGVDTVVVEGRDLANGWGGDTVEVAVPGR